MQQGKHMASWLQQRYNSLGQAMSISEANINRLSSQASSTLPLVLARLQVGWNEPLWSFVCTARSRLHTSSDRWEPMCVCRLLSSCKALQQRRGASPRPQPWCH